MTGKLRKYLQREAIRKRAGEALSDLYHNATPNYPGCRNDFEQDRFNSWFEDAARAEIDYIQSGGANPIEKGFGSRRLTLKEKMYRDRTEIERAKFAPWEWVSKYGKLYTYGRGGRTLAPADLIRTRGGSGFHILAEAISLEWDIPRLVELIRIVESFNAHVSAWCKSIPEQWEEEKKETGLNRRIWHYDNKRRVSRVKYA